MWPVHRGAKYTRGRSSRRSPLEAARRFAVAGVAASLTALVPAAGRPASAARAAYGQRLRMPSSPPARTINTAREVWGFFAPWDPRSAASVASHRNAMSVVVSGWVRLDSASGQPTLAYHDSVRGSSRLRRFALVTTYAGSRFHPEVVRMLGADPALRARVASAIAHRASTAGYSGLVLDFEALAPADSDALAAVVRTITDSAHRHHVRPVAVAVPPADTALYGHRHLRAADLLMVMLYDQHWSTGAPGPIASPDWARSYLAAWVAEAGAHRIVAALPVYGYLWKAPQPATVLSFTDALREVEVAGVPLARDSASSSLYFVRPDSAQGWVSDALLLNILMHDAAAAGVHRFALWRLGLEDPAIWAKK